jgi:plasmid stabilization system protein ParE
MTVTVRSQAHRDISEALQFYLDEETPHSAERFAGAVDTAYDEIIEAPYRYPSDRDGIRQKIIRGFPFSVLYHLNGNEIVIVSIRHHKRKPGFWRTRLS